MIFFFFFLMNEILLKVERNFFNARFTLSSRALIETFGELWMRQGIRECTYSHSYSRAKRLASKRRRDIRFLWLEYDLLTCFWELWEETRTGTNVPFSLLLSSRFMLSRQECNHDIKICGKFSWKLREIHLKITWNFL